MLALLAVWESFSADVSVSSPLKNILVKSCSLGKAAPKVVSGSIWSSKSKSRVNRSLGGFCPTGLFHALAIERLLDSTLAIGRCHSF